jgi:carboxyl-terminal processing protease
LGKAEDEALAASEDDGLQDDERDITKDLNADDSTPEIDTLMRESAHILVDAIELLQADKALAAQVYPKASGTLAD